VNERGKKIKTSDIPITNDGTYEGYQGFLQILEMSKGKFGYKSNQTGIREVPMVSPVGGCLYRLFVLALPLGAEWIWIHIPPFLKKLKCLPETYQLLDFYHAASHLQDFADAAFSTNNERQEWFKKARKTLKKGQALDLIRTMGEFIFEATGERCKIHPTRAKLYFKSRRR
jgi:hypothetical protein